MKYICTIFTDSHIAQALTLWESVCNQSAEWKFLALRIGRGEFGEKVPVDFCKCCIGLDSLDCDLRPRFWYDVFEFCNYAKSLLHEYMWSIPGVDEWWFVDGDCLFTCHPDCLSVLWRGKPIIVCPHRQYPVIDYRQQDVSFAFYGAYNGGLLGIQRQPESRAFIEWFSNRLTWLSFQEPSLGMYVDQRWLDLAAVYFDTDIVKDDGLNVGYWNFSDAHTDGITRMKLLHMSQVRFDGNQAILTVASNMDGRTMAAFLQYANQYYARVMHWKERAGGVNSYSFANFYNGVKINRIARRAYYCDVLEGIAPENPFDHVEYNKCDPQVTLNRFMRHVNAPAINFGEGLFCAKPEAAKWSSFCSRFKGLRKRIWK